MTPMSFDPVRSILEAARLWADPTEEHAVLQRAFELASDQATSAIDGCDCTACVETREEMRAMFLRRAREQLGLAS